jgi:uroporphyrinogen decarboxylase
MSGPEKAKLLDTLFLIHEEFGVDGFTSFEIGHETEIDPGHTRDGWGVVYTRSPHGLPVPTGHPLDAPEKLKAYLPPEPKREHLLLLDMGRERFKGNVALFWLMRGTFVLSWRLVGMANLMYMMVDKPGFVHDIARMTDIAQTHAPLISPRLFCEFVNPYNRKIVERAKALGLKVVRHSDGNLWQLLDILLDTGYDGLNPLEPHASMDLKRVKQYCGDRICLLGNIDCLELLPDGTPEQVDAAVRQAIEDAGAGGGLIICSSNSLHPGVNPENCIAMFEATRKYGVYA